MVIVLQGRPSVLQRIKDDPAVNRIYDAVFGFVRTFLYRLSPVLTARQRFRLETGRALPLHHPVTFDEKLFWLMLFWRHPLKAQCADKLGVRRYAEGLGLGHLLVDLIGVFETPEAIDFGALPDQFALKGTHGCGYNIICRDKAALDPERTRRQLARWMKQDYARVYGEVQYEGLTPRILCEPFLDDGTGRAPTDFKLHCFHGKVHYTTVCTGRGPDGQGAHYDHYDREWRRQMPISTFGVHPERWHPQPAGYEAMVEAAERLSKPFPFVRVDFYSVRGKVLLGEMTFTPGGCLDPGLTDEAQRALGDLIHLPEPLHPLRG